MLKFTFALVIGAAQAHAGDFPPGYFASASDSAYALSTGDAGSFLADALGSNMVLQRAPQQAVVWGFASMGTTVTTSMDGIPMTTKAGVDGVWRQILPATPASSTTHNFTFVSSVGDKASMDNVLFGDVYLCGGQSNMQFAIPAIENATAEIALADHYPSIRLFTVGQKTSSATPLGDLQTIEQPWSVASHQSIAGGGGFGLFSAVCWIFGREVFDRLGGTVPIGLVSNNWGGTPVESWTTPAVLKACNLTTVDSSLYNSMINPYTVGPMALTGFTWYQGEANVDERRGDEGAARYACTFPGMIRQWREAFNAPDAYFGFVQLSTWCGDGELIAEMRTIGQMAALMLPKVGYATNADHGAGCNIHPPPKQYCGTRLANSAMALQYGSGAAWKSASFKLQTTATSPPSATVTLKDVSAAGLRDDQYPYNYLGGTFNCTQNAGKCAWAELQLGNGTWVNATISVGSGSATLVLTATAGMGAPIASRYGWGAVPMLSVYDKGTGLPVLPWSSDQPSY